MQSELRFGLVQVDARTFLKPDSQIHGVASFDGYIIIGLSYGEAATFWSEELYGKPGYTSLPPVTAISTTATVSGSVED
jgi:hypothetical protein